MRQSAAGSPLNGRHTASLLRPDSTGQFPYDLRMLTRESSMRGTIFGSLDSGLRLYERPEGP
jgi:hypothetical protein